MLMPDFHTFTLNAAAEVLSKHYDTHYKVDALVFSWGCADMINSSTIPSKFLDLVRLAASQNPGVRTARGKVFLNQAMIEAALIIPEARRKGDNWNKLVAGLRMDGFEVCKEDGLCQRSELVLRRMLPADIPGLDFREAESEVVTLLDRSDFTMAKGHLNQALSAFQRGEWSSANGELRNFYESYLNDIASSLGYTGNEDSKAKRDFLGHCQPPFLLAGYNEWDGNSQKPQYVQGLMSRMHPHGGHPGLSEEEDATFRLQISLITARLFLRRFIHRRAC